MSVGQERLIKIEAEFCCGTIECLFRSACATRQQPSHSKLTLTSCKYNISSGISFFNLV